MKTECKILTCNLETASKSTIESYIENYCNDSFFKEKSIKDISTTQISQNPDNFIVTIIYESRIKWLKILVFIAIIFVIAFIIFNFLNLINEPNQIR